MNETNSTKFIFLFNLTWEKSFHLCLLYRIFFSHIFISAYYILFDSYRSGKQAFSTIFNIGAPWSVSFHQTVLTVKGKLFSQIFIMTICKNIEKLKEYCNK